MSAAVRRLLLAALALACLPGAGMAQTLAITSPAFKDGERMHRSLGCEAGEHSPALTVSGVPAGAKTLAILMTESDTPKGAATLWMAYNIPAAASVTVVENQPRARQMKGEGLQAAVPGGKMGFVGPCPPPGVTKRYALEAFALDTALELPETLTRQQFLLAVEGHIVAMGKILGKYKK